MNLDANLLAALWPRELNDYQLLIISLVEDPHTGQGLFRPTEQPFHLIRPLVPENIADDGSWRGKDIIMVRFHDHFTLLQPPEGGEPATSIQQLSEAYGFDLASEIMDWAHGEDPGTFRANQQSIVDTLEAIVSAPEPESFGVGGGGGGGGGGGPVSGP